MQKFKDNKVARQHDGGNMDHATPEPEFDVERIPAKPKPEHHLNYTRACEASGVGVLPCRSDILARHDDSAEALHACALR